ncbi:hypothetical protein THAOC_06074 [Thalassiosira oceanica]|uniref:SAM domain-containing protein n=1 Tax=Thalassiosira oceanica TaxID=159749 RepID=K0TFM9_THAOC|nr:hypothetical protein THAOC_06074 [Thalassiosira oceanica]|eukprot:EJK72401.1 hypothetical protein THAOC_06074 [Thalassiosira oceanica]
MNPASWSPTDVQDWARRKGLPHSTATALAENEVDGPTLLTLDREELRADLGITSLPARRFLYELILSLKSYQISTDRTRAIDVLEEEIDSLQSGREELSTIERNCTDPTAVEVLRSDAEIQRQIISDHLFALRLHSSNGQQFYEDKQFAQDESERYNQLAIQSQFDRRYAESLEGNRRGRTRSNEFDDDNSTIASLFGLTIETCVKNKVNVAEALAKGTIKIIPRLSDIESDLVSTEDFADPEENLRRLPAIPSCMVCYDENIQGFNLACGQHSICIDCSRNLFQSAVRDTSLLPLRCCDVPIDMNISSWLLSPEDSNLIQFRMYEMSAREKV